MLRLGMCQCAVLFAALLYQTSSFAFLPVVDYPAIANLIKQYEQLQAQYHLLQRGVATAKQQLQQTKAITNTATGHYGLGHLLNASSDLRARDWSPHDWEAALQGLSGGSPERYQQLLTLYNQHYPGLSEAAFKQGATAEQARRYQQQLNTNRAVSVNASYAFNTISQHLKQVHQLSAKIEAANNTKAAIDLNSRLLTELAYIQLQQLKMQAIANKQHADATAMQLYHQQVQAQFNRINSP